MAPTETALPRAVLPPRVDLPLRDEEDPESLDGGADDSEVADAPMADAPMADSPMDREHEAGPERLRRIFDEQFSFVWRYLRRLGLPPVDADDATQQVFLVLSRKLSRVPPEKERAFLCGTAVRVFSDARRAQSRRREIPGDTPVDAPDPKAGPEMLTGREQARALLDTVLDKMDEKTRSVFVLFELEELSTAEIAEIRQSCRRDRGVAPTAGSRELRGHRRAHAAARRASRRRP
ncbi:MAG: sigma-70 family RNA polymerase sigma factor [Polyangiaceae bacterium]